MATAQEISLQGNVFLPLPPQSGDCLRDSATPRKGETNSQSRETTLEGRRALHSLKRADRLQLYREAQRFYPVPTGFTYQLPPGPANHFPLYNVLRYRAGSRAPLSGLLRVILYNRLRLISAKAAA